MSERRPAPITDPGIDARARAARVLAEVLAGRASLPEAFARHGEGARDVAFVRELCWGAARHAPSLDARVRAHLKSPPRSRDLDVHALLIVGAYQLLWMEVPDHAGVHATVGATRALRKDWAKGLVNAVLRRLAEEGRDGGAPLDAALRTDHPAWLLEALDAAWPEDRDAIVAAGNARPPMTLRARDGSGAGIAALAAAGIEARAGTLAPDAVYLAQPRAVTHIPGFESGAFSVQDEGAQLAAVLLDAAPGMRVLDACAAPGGKTLHIAQRTPELELHAVDADARRVGRIRENLQRGGVEAHVHVGDARDPGVAGEGGFDRILLDAPCTATGILRRQPDVRLLRRESDVAKLAAVQRALLDALWARLNTGGLLVYCTCSVLPQEGEMVVRGFLEAHPEATVRPADSRLGRPRTPGLQLLPTEREHDGFFYACIERPDA